MGQKSRLRAERRLNERDEPQDGLDGKEAIEIIDGSPPQEVAPPEIVPRKEDEDDIPLEVLKRQFEEVKAERDASDRKAMEAEQRAREDRQKAARYETGEITSQKAFLEQAFGNEEFKLNDAKRRFASALADGKHEEAADAQAEMMRAQGVMQTYAFQYQEIERKEKEPKQVSQDDQFEAALKTMHPKVAAWARDHRDDVLKPERQRLAFAADAMATAKGYAPGTDEYLDFLDEQMGYLESEPEPKPAPVQNGKVSRRAPAAPVSKSSGSSPSRRVYLNEDDKHQARQLGISDQDYAALKLRASEQSGGSNVNSGMRHGMRVTFTAGE